MKKLLLTLGATAAIMAPVASVVACGNEKPTTQGGQTPTIPGGQTPTTPGGQAPTTSGQQIPTIPGGQAPTTPVQQVPAMPVQQGQKTNSQIIDNSYLTKFKISEITEDPYVQNFDKISGHSPSSIFKVFDNGLFKIKIQNTLIGTGKLYSSMEKAELQAKDIADSINIGPAITHLPKGIQIIDSPNGNSFGASTGVQIAINSKQGSLDDKGIRNEASLIDHEYGHHETLWDFENIVGGNESDTDFNDTSSLWNTMYNGLKNAGYTKMADVVARYVKGSPQTGFSPALASAFPTDYAGINVANHQVFNNANYPFNHAEVATRVLNILSCRTDLSAKDLYGIGTDGKWLKADGSPRGYGLDLPAAFTSDLTFRKFSGDSVFGEGKDSSRVNALVDFYMKDIFGVGQGKLHLLGDITHNKITGINMSGFGLGDLTTMEIQDQNGSVVQSIKVNSFNSRFGFKNQLVSDKWAITRNDKVVALNDAKVDLNLSVGTFKLVGKDSQGKDVDISMLKLSDASLSDNSASLTGFHGIKPEGNHLVFSK